ncbi:substrate-binding periplasmic protein [Pseudobacteriovorax antillogorgiicola]|uniref:Extracellular solute-binding protein, family 3 n=1 Tax=Pseudobacteriovorax antillogorgiicola TaxID=1513793 RepID=A0A1Y6BA53_9BACT|nr:transporter substrate-binding domain-containing protein [Pseudobacteriovorax antillogorgiicola]TCS57438.1 extracellular solute-binding protein (family 3) [Pseudobacteriovorax antillogorgiicola]SMF01067.1 extracellular solute-binding protein, family 3 [Pseudobacteriovorax antillogorgiicola]
MDRFVAFIMLVLATSTLAEPKFRICFDDQSDLKLFGQGHTSKESSSFYTDIIARLEASQKITVRIERMPTVRCLGLMKAGHMDAMVLSYSRKRDRDICEYPPKTGGHPDSKFAFVDDSYYLMTLPGSSVTWDGSYESIRQLNIGAIRSYSIVQVLRKKGIEVDESRDADTLLRKLTLGRLQALALSAGSPIFHQLKMHSPALTHRYYYLVFSKGFFKGNTALVKAIWQDIAQLKASGELREIGEQHGLISSQFL